MKYDSYDDVQKDLVDGIISLEDANAIMEVMLMRSAYYKKFPKEQMQILQKGVHKGKYYIRYKGIQIFRKDYNRIIEKIIEIDNMNPSNDDHLSLNDIADDFFKFRFLKVASSTYSKDISNYNVYIKNEDIASIPITDITYDDAVRWAEIAMSKKDEMRKRYFDNVRTTLNVMISYAVKQRRIIQKNPLDGFSVHKDHFSSKELTAKQDRFFNDDELDTVFSLAYEEVDNTGEVYALGVLLIALTGIRIGELCALRWCDVEGNYLHVQTEVVEDQDVYGKRTGWKWVDHCKTEAGNRLIPLNSEAIDILRRVKTMCFSSAISCKQEDFIFSRVVNNVYTFCSPRVFDYRLEKICKKAGFHRKSAHDLRRTFATNASYAGIKTKVIQGWMGHESISQTEAYICTKPNDVNEFNDIEKLTRNSKTVSKNKQVI